jgi:hypothetical protein
MSQEDAMWTNRGNEAELEAAVRAWARHVGVADARPLQVAVEKALAAHRRGATAAQAAGVGRAFVLSWQRHPANSAPRVRSDVA